MGDHYEEIQRCMDQELRDREENERNGSSEVTDGTCYISGIVERVIPQRPWWKRGICRWTLAPVVAIVMAVLYVVGYLLILVGTCVGTVWTVLYKVFPPLPFILSLILLSVIFGR